MIKRELAVFLLVGSLTVLVDFLMYRGLLYLGWLGVDVSKAAGFLVGTLFAYVANRFWTFGMRPHAPGSFWRFTVLYLATLGANVAVNASALHALATNPARVQVAFLLATAVSATLNFMGMKFLVFKPRADYP